MSRYSNGRVWFCSNEAEILGIYHTLLLPPVCDIESNPYPIDFSYELSADNLAQCIEARISAALNPGPTNNTKGSPFRGNCLWDDTPEKMDPACADWGCTCQKLSNKYRVTHRRTFGEAPEAAVKW